MSDLLPRQPRLRLPPEQYAALLQARLGARRLALQGMRFDGAPPGASREISEPTRMGRDGKLDHALREMPPKIPRELRRCRPSTKTDEAWIGLVVSDEDNLRDSQRCFPPRQVSCSATRDSPPRVCHRSSEGQTRRQHRGHKTWVKYMGKLKHVRKETA